MALQLGKTVGEIESGMSSRELSEWLAFSTIEPFPDPYWIGAQIAHAVVSVMGGKARFEDFLPRVEPRSGPIRLSPKQSAGMLGRMVNRI